MAEYDLHKKAAAIVRDAGGRLIGRTRLQKVTYLAQLAGFADDFQFEYRHYGPYSEELAAAMEIAAGLQIVQEEERETDWGGWYSTYRVDPETHPEEQSCVKRAEFVAAAAGIGAIELELAATAAFLYSEEEIVGQNRKKDPWKETALRKPDKAANGRLKRAKSAYRKLARIATPKQLPPIA
jgi:hypothetical protein